MWPYLVILLAFAADRLSKWWAAEYLARRGPTEINALLTLEVTYNRGIAFGLVQGVGSVVGWLSILVVIGLFLYLRRLPRTMWLPRLGLALIIGGAMGNLIDRVSVGEVLDFIHTPLRSGVFNVADVMINSGLVVTLVGSLLQKPPPEEPVAGLGPEAAAAAGSADDRPESQPEDNPSSGTQPAHNQQQSGEDPGEPAQSDRPVEIE
jgi:signal peptidase II